MQPTYFPWAGYFNLIQCVDAFVFLDDAQYERGTWHNRNRVMVNGKAQWLTVPVIRDRLGDPLNRVRTDEKLPWRKKHVSLLQQSYGKHPFGKEVLEIAAPSIDRAGAEVLAALNMAIIGALCEKLDVTTRILRSSEIGVAGKRTERLIAICQHLGCDEYLSPPGAIDYLTEDRFCERASARLLVNEYAPQSYEQRGSGEFVSHLSILDVAANLGWPGAARYVRNPATLRPVEPSHVR
jgi:WbqC-like protein family